MLSRTPLDLTDTQWEVLEPLLPVLPRRADGRGRPWADSRKLLNGMLWVLRTGAQWQDLPSRYGTKSTCHRRFQQWIEAGIFEQILKALAEDLKERGGLDLSECFVDATFASAKKGDPASALPAGARAARSWQWQTKAGLPLAIHVESASPAEVRLVGAVLERALQMLSRSD